MTLKYQLANKLREAIKKSGKTQAEIAALSGVSQSVISSFTSGKQSLSIEKAEKLALAIGYKIRLANVKQLSTFR